jgi:hypothetical protein
MKPVAKALLADERGVIFVEALLVYAPILFSFFAAWQLAELATTDLVLERAVSAASRAAIVTFPDAESYYVGEAVDGLGGARRREAIKKVVSDVFRAAPAIDPTSIELQFEFVGPGLGEERLLETRLSVRARCFGGTLASFVCGPSGSMRLSAKTRDVYHGARYLYTMASRPSTRATLFARPVGALLQG